MKFRGDCKWTSERSTVALPKRCATELVPARTRAFSTPSSRPCASLKEHRLGRGGIIPPSERRRLFRPPRGGHLSKARRPEQHKHVVDSFFFLRPLSFLFYFDSLTPRSLTLGASSTSHGASARGIAAKNLIPPGWIFVFGRAAAILVGLFHAFVRQFRRDRGLILGREGRDRMAA